MPTDFFGGLVPQTNTPLWGGATGNLGNTGGALPGGSPIGAPAAYPGTWNPAYGGIPQIPNPTSTAGGAIGGNIQNMAALLQQILGASGASAAGANAQYAANLPGYAPMTQSASSNIQANLAGQVPIDVQRQLQQQAAERGIGVGVGSPNSNAALLRALGLTSLGRQDVGQQQLTAAINRTPVGPLQNPANYLVTPEQQQAAAAGQSYLNAAPLPAASAAARMRQLLAGLQAGRGSGYMGGGGLPSPTSQSPTGSILQRYMPTFSGQPQGGSGAPLQSNPDYITFPDGTIVDPFTGETIAQAPQGTSQDYGTPEDYFSGLGVPDYTAPQQDYVTAPTDNYYDWEGP